MADIGSYSKILILNGWQDFRSIGSNSCFRMLLKHKGTKSCEKLI